jgi:hypothetical protein
MEHALPYLVTEHTASKEVVDDLFVLQAEDVSGIIGQSMPV